MKIFYFCFLFYVQTSLLYLKSITYLGTGDGAKLCKLLSQALIIDVAIQILDVQVDSLVPVDPLHPDALKLLLQLGLALDFLLSTSNKQHFTRIFISIQSLHSLELKHPSKWTFMNSFKFLCVFEIWNQFQHNSEFL